MNDNKVTGQSRPKYEENYPTLTARSVQNFMKHADDLIERSIGGPHKHIGICESVYIPLTNTIGSTYRGYTIIGYGHNINVLLLF
jgi:hypothetical protein